MQALKRCSVGLLQSLLAALFLWTATTCIGAEKTAVDPFKIVKIDYLIENIHPSFWKEKENDRSFQLFYNFFIYIEDIDIQLKKIEEVAVYNKYDSRWKLDLKKDVNLDGGYIGGFVHLFDNILSQNSTLLSVSDLRVVITFKNGQKVAKNFAIAAPGLADPSPRYQYIYNGNFRGRIAETYIPALEQGKITDLEFTNNRFEITFVAFDRRITNGYIAFYDKDKNYIGETLPFVNWYSGEIAELINEGKQFDITGGPNEVAFGPGEIQLGKKQKIAKIRYVQVCLTDGSQFAKTKFPNNYYYSSGSELIPIKIK